MYGLVRFGIFRQANTLFDSKHLVDQQIRALPDVFSFCDLRTGSSL